MAIVFGFGGAFISLVMSKNIALRSVSGTIVKTPKNKTEYWLLETINKQAQKTGIGMPTVAIYNSEDMNAFATGAQRDSSLIAISTALLKNMTKDEAEAVLAHEVSHIANGDMVTMTLMQGVINTFVIFLSRFIANAIASNNKENNNEPNMMVYFIASMALELVFGLLASLITMWYSRYREYHADANAARLVGKDKMIAALERLKTSHEPQLEDSMIAFGIHGKHSLTQLLMSHPPIHKRIHALRKNLI
ncbi:protease htpX [Candidatus Photodesmus blepharus]|uniref:Protease htpX n=2 Tax=Candidatus Photodesmus blepharonis TaxID=1179155 RepID=A0A084CNB2_9GAMM|nr:protease htpX [Candidatus Photodesmus blepharus]